MLYLISIFGTVKKSLSLGNTTVAICNFKPPKRTHSNVLEMSFPRIFLGKRFVGGISVGLIAFNGKWTNLGSARTHRLSKKIVGRAAGKGERWVLYRQGNRWLAVDWEWATESKNVK
ncbi:hypothetical protein GYA13_01985 [Candidatus Kuenenbacteria bacterium]|nr:hypothetical protein [Candidatus Kuenenbacteria bacterium]